MTIKRFNLFIFFIALYSHCTFAQTSIGTKHSPSELNLLVDTILVSNISNEEKAKIKVTLQGFNNSFSKVDKIDLFIISKVIIYKNISKAIDSNSIFTFKELKQYQSKIQKVDISSYSPFLEWIITSNIADIESITKSEARFKKEPKAKVKMIGKISEAILTNTSDSLEELMIPVMLQALDELNRYISFYIKYTPLETIGKKLTYFDFNKESKLSTTDELNKLIDPITLNDKDGEDKSRDDSWKPKNDITNIPDINYQMPAKLPDSVNDWSNDNETLIQSVIYDYIPPDTLPQSVDDWKTNKELNKTRPDYSKPNRLPMPVEDWSDVEEIKKIDYGTDLDSDSTIY